MYGAHKSEVLSGSRLNRMGRKSVRSIVRRALEVELAMLASLAFDFGYKSLSTTGRLRQRECEQRGSCASHYSRENRLLLNPRKETNVWVDLYTIAQILNGALLSHIFRKWCQTAFN